MFFSKKAHFTGEKGKAKPPKTGLFNRKNRKSLAKDRKKRFLGKVDSCLALTILLIGSCFDSALRPKLKN